MITTGRQKTIFLLLGERFLNFPPTSALSSQLMLNIYLKANSLHNHLSVSIGLILVVIIVLCMIVMFTYLLLYDFRVLNFHSFQWPIILICIFLAYLCDQT